MIIFETVSIDSSKAMNEPQSKLADLPDAFASDRFLARLVAQNLLSIAAG
jgi:hypothetical protein